MTELKRRNVFRVGVAYVVAAWLILQLTDVLSELMELESDVGKIVIILLVVGFIPALIFAWAFELTPEGIKRESAVAPDESITHQTGRKLDFFIIGVLAVVVIYFAVDKFLLQSGVEQVDRATGRIPAAELVGQEKSIAVLPFANMSGDPEQEFFSDGISEELLNVLAKVKGLQVTSRTSAFAFKGKDISIPKIAAELGVEHVLEGSVRMAGNRVRITTQLIKVDTDSHLWSESYDRDLADIFAVQDEIAAKVGEALKVALLGADSKPIHPSRKISVEAYSDYLLARQKLANMSYVGAGEAELLLQGVIERDPDYAPAYAALAGTHQIMAGWGASSPSEAVARMGPLVEQALSLDDGLAEAWQNLAYTREVQSDLEGARMAEERALELEPQNPVVLVNQIIRWLWSHEPERGLVYAEELLRVDPLSLQGLRFIASQYRRLDRRDDAERMFERMRSIDPQNTWYLWGGFFLANGHGDLVKALEFAEGAASIDIADPEGPSGIAMLYLELGDFAAAEFWIDAALRLDSEAPHARAMKALLHLYRDEESEAVAIARELTQPGSRSRAVSRAIALRIEAGPDLAAGNYEEIITRNLTHYPELADGRLPAWRRSIEPHQLFGAFVVSLDLASVYLHAGEEAKGRALLSLVESELPHWPRTALWRYGVADVELHALRGEKAEALAALQEHADTGMRDKWRWQLLYNPNLASIRDTPEFAAIVAKIEADMSEQLARVREMQRGGELEPIPEISETTQ
jgi:TolB-like protein/Tfp pilus assembly protein PilF